MSQPIFFFAALLLVLMTPTSGLAEDPRREKAKTLQNDGLWEEAHALYDQLIGDPSNTGIALSDDIRGADECLRRLGAEASRVALCEQVFADRPMDPRAIMAAARVYHDLPHHEVLIDNKVERTGGRGRQGGGVHVDLQELDRSRILQVLDSMRPLLADKDLDRGLRGAYWRLFREVLESGRQGPAFVWRLQELSDLKTLPEPDPTRHGTTSSNGPPVGRDGRPVFFSEPDSFDTAINDGERWRWCIEQEGRLSAHDEAYVRMVFADWLRELYGVQTLQRYGYRFPAPDEAGEGKAQRFALHTLGENETICQLANGVRRIELPDEFNFIKIYRELEAGNSRLPGWRDTPVRLARVFENRRQYTKAVDSWELAAKRGENSEFALQQLLGDQVRFDGTGNHPSGKEPTLGIVFRNATKARFSARAIDTERLLAELREYLESNPEEVRHEQTNLRSIGYDIVRKGEKEFVGDEVAAWDADLDPAPGHWDRRTDVKVPISKAGAYWVRVEVGKGKDLRASNLILWIDDLAIVRKGLDNALLYYVADAASGEPVAGAKLDFFGWCNERRKILKLNQRFDVKIDTHEAETGEDGFAIVKKGQVADHYQWLVTASTEDKRTAFLGFEHIWFPTYDDQTYQQEKGFLLTDRPAYRPGDTVKVKGWASRTAYEEDGKSMFAGKSFQIIVNSARGEQVLKQSVKADRFGGFDFEHILPDDAQLGSYQVRFDGAPHGNVSFRVEEYKKPEFEVIVTAPDEPVELGDTFQAKVEAKYYFGAPVTNATVKYKVLRSEHDTRWFPAYRWDWLYGNGYWWQGYDYPWYPGWGKWGCDAPRWHWWGRWQQAPPEVIVETEVPIGENGTVELEIDSALALALHGDSDHRYSISVEVIDESRRTIMGSGSVIAARKPYQVYAWNQRGYYRAGDTSVTTFTARTPDGKQVVAQGDAVLYRISYDPDSREPEETEVARVAISLGDPAKVGNQGRAEVRFDLAQPGQYRVAATVKDGDGREAEGATIFVVRGDAEDEQDTDFRFGDLELVLGKLEYKPGEELELLVNTERSGLPVLLFPRPSNGVYKEPSLLRGEGRSRAVDLKVEKSDMPNFFVEAVAVVDGEVVTAIRQVIVPPESRILDLAVEPDAETYGPADTARVKIRLTGPDGTPHVGSAAVTVYDKSLEYISGGSNVPQMRDYFWKWTRSHQPQTRHNLGRQSSPLVEDGMKQMSHIGVFGHSLADDSMALDGRAEGEGMAMAGNRGAPGRSMRSRPASMPMPAPMMMKGAAVAADSVVGGMASGIGADKAAGGAAELVQPTVRTDFADAAYWVASIETDEDGSAVVDIPMPENLTTWKIKVWAMGDGTRVGEGEAEVITRKDLLVRLQTPRFLVEGDQATVSANVHNYLETAKDIRVELEIDGDFLGAEGGGELEKIEIQVPPGGDKRVDWPVIATSEGEAVIRVKALTNEESDAMELSLPVRVHGMLKTESWSGALSGAEVAENSQTITVTVPEKRISEQSVLEVRYSPTVAGAMVDALPYLADYPHGCTEQTLNRFVPSVITQSVLEDIGIDLKSLREKATNLNPQELGDDKARAEGWKRFKRNPVFSEGKIDRMVKKGVTRLQAMQNRDGGWGWFSGTGSRSYPHTTAVVVEGLFLAGANGANINQNSLAQGVAWLEQHRDKEITKLQNDLKGSKVDPHKSKANNVDALVQHVLVLAGSDSVAMRDFLYRDRTSLSHYGLALLGLSLDVTEQTKERDMCIANLRQFLTIDTENQTAYLERGNSSWWYWYGDEMEAMAATLRLLSRTDPQGEVTSGLAKYILNNRKHATYWKSTRDTAYCISALAEYLRATEEMAPDLKAEVLINGESQGVTHITTDNLFDYDNQVRIEGADVGAGDQEITIRRSGKGPLYWNAYLTNFTKKDFIIKAGLEVKVERRYYRIDDADEKQVDVDAKGGLTQEQRDLENRVPIDNMDGEVTSGDIIEVELIVTSKNDYEYLLITDPKVAGCEPHAVRSGYIRIGSLGAYMELRDESVDLFVRRLPRGTHSLTYRLRAETPGKFSALPAKVEAMYAPELVGNSDEQKLQIADR